MTTPNFSIPELAAAQAQKHVTVNQALRVVDTAMNLTVIRRDFTDPPVSPAAGAKYIPAATAGGAWTGRENEVAAFVNGQWVFFQPQEGWRCYDQTLNQLLVFDGSSWAPLDAVSSGSLADGSVLELGVNTGADSTNRLAVKSDAILFSHDDVTPGSGDIHISVNKDGAANDAGFVFQTGFSTRAIFGLLGSDEFALSVSANGSAFNPALTIHPGTGNVAIRAGADANNALLVSGESSLFTNSGDLRFTFSKGATGDDCALTFQSNFSGRALIGLLGSDDFAFTVSPDGSAYTQALVIDKDDAAVSFPQHPKFAGFTNFQQYNAADAWFQVSINDTTGRHNDQGALSSGIFTAPHDGYYVFGGGAEFELN
ncbi:DUF2793 domain-containing protein, partial [Brucella abortus]